MIFQAAQNVFIQRKERRKEKNMEKKTVFIFLGINRLENMRMRKRT